MYSLHFYLLLSELGPKLMQEKVALFIGPLQINIRKKGGFPEMLRVGICTEGNIYYRHILELRSGGMVSTMVNSALS